jgi:hypothetical protein
MTTEIITASLSGDLLLDPVLTAQDMAYLNFAREEYRKLDLLMHRVVLPALGPYDNPLSNELRVHLEQVRTFSGNFCWRHRAIGEMHMAREVRP